MTLKGWILFAFLVGLAALVKPSLHLDASTHEQPPGMSTSVWDEDDEEVAGAEGTEIDRGTEETSRARSTDQAQAGLPGADEPGAGPGVWDRRSPTPPPSRSAALQQQAAGLQNQAAGLQGQAAGHEVEDDRSAGEPTGSVTADAVAQRPAEPPSAVIPSASSALAADAAAQRSAGSPGQAIRSEPQATPATAAGEQPAAPASASKTVADAPSATATGGDPQSAERVRVSAMEVDDRFRSEQKRALDLTDKLAEAQSGLEQMRAELTHTRARSDEWQHAAEEASGEASKARADVAAARAETVALQERRDSDLQGAESRAASLQGQLDSEQAQVAMLSHDIDAARARTAEAESQSAIEADARKALEAASDDLAAKLQDERARSAALADDLAKASATIRQVQEQANKPQASNSGGPSASVQAVSSPPGRPAPPVASVTEARPRRMLASIGAPLPPTRRLPPSPAADTVKTMPRSVEDRAAASQATSKSGPTAQTERPDREASHGSSVRTRPAVRAQPTEAHRQVVTVVVDKTPDQDGEGYTSADYSPYDTSDHTIYIDDVVSRGRTPCGRRTCVVNRGAAVRVAKRDTTAR